MKSSPIGVATRTTANSFSENSYSYRQLFVPPPNNRSCCATTQYRLALYRLSIVIKAGMFSNQDWNAATSHSTLPMLISLWTIFYILCEWRDKYIYVCIRAVGIYLYIRWCWYEQKKMCTQHHSYRKIIRKERDKTYVPSPIGRECFPSDTFFFLPQKNPDAIGYTYRCCVIQTVDRKAKTNLSFSITHLLSKWHGNEQIIRHGSMRLYSWEMFGFTPQYYIILFWTLSSCHSSTSPSSSSSYTLFFCEFFEFSFLFLFL